MAPEFDDEGDSADGVGAVIRISRPAAILAAAYAFNDGDSEDREFARYLFGLYLDERY